MITNNLSFKEIEDKLADIFDEYRFRHTLGVAYTSAALAMANGYDVEKARLAGLLHDCAKAVPGKDRVSICEERGIEISEVERVNTSLLHSKIGVAFAKEQYGIDDEEILGAIRWHTTGKCGMNMLEQIVYIADYIEPNREDNMTIDPAIRTAAFKDLDMGCYLIMKETVGYIETSGKTMDKQTIDAYNYYKQLIENK